MKPKIIKHKKTNKDRLLFLWKILKAVLFFPKDFVFFLKDFVQYTFSFMILLIVYIAERIFLRIARFRFIPRILVVIFGTPLRKIYSFVVNISRYDVQSMNRINIIDIAFRNMKFKRSRSLITIGGMSVGISAIVFLVSLGYGVERMVISKVAKLDEMRQVDIHMQPGGRNKINDEIMAALSGIPEVHSILPLISVAGKVTYGGSVSDTAVYGVTSDYLNSSAIRPSRGKIFDSNEVSFSLFDKDADTEERISSIYYEEEALGSDSNLSTAGIFSENKNIDYTEPQVLGEETEANPENESTESAETVANTIVDSTGSGLGWVELESEIEKEEGLKIKKVNLAENAIRQAVVNRALLKILGINEEEAIDKEIEVSFTVTSDLLENEDEKIESEIEKYKIVGIIPEEKTPLFYVSFIDLRSLGIVNYSQIKLITQNQEVLNKVRNQVETMGFMTHSVVDTVNQINTMFATARIILAFLGTIALSVAALGMFNTLTVSLLERTREVGLMKVMGMKSVEIKELFLTESMIMGFMGGLMGLLIGFFGGKFLGLGLSAYSTAKGFGTMDISHIPGIFIGIILFLSLIVGIGTGFYPARRAKRISALNALRYE